jgi:hypothetical protein
MKPRHAWSALIVVFVVFVAINIRSEVRRTKPGEFGRLNGRTVSSASQPVEIVEEAPAPVSDETSADPMLVAPAAREQYLHVQQSAQPERVIEPIAAPQQTMPRQGKGRFTIVGGPEGVTLVDAPRCGQ